MRALELLDAMFPGDPARLIPAAAATGTAARLAALLPDLEALLIGEAVPDDPNAALRILRARASDLVDRFTEQAVIAYFSDPAVAHALTGKPTPLFPNHSVLPEIDHDLVEPVLRAFGHD